MTTKGYVLFKCDKCGQKRLLRIMDIIRIQKGCLQLPPCHCGCVSYTRIDDIGFEKTKQTSLNVQQGSEGFD
jgi:hypothetical protein